MNTKHTATLFSILAAALYAINIPFSKLLLTHVQPDLQLQSAQSRRLRGGYFLPLWRSVPVAFAPPCAIMAEKGSYAQKERGSRL